MNSKYTKRAWLASVLSIVLCLSMLVGTTFAWFTDTASTGVNKILAGNLDVALYQGEVVNNAITYSDSEVTTETKLFDDAALWEPGHVEVAYLKVENKGNLALKYQLAVNVGDEVSGKNGAGEEIKLSEVLKFAAVEIDSTTFYADRSAAMNAAEAASAGNLVTTVKSGEMLKNNDDVKFFALVVYMPETVGNEANYVGIQVPQIKLGVKLNATQKDNEFDSFGNDYDQFAGYESKLLKANGIARIYNALDMSGVINRASIYVSSKSVSEDTYAEFAAVKTAETSTSQTYQVSLTDSEGNAVDLLKKNEMTLYVPERKKNVKVTRNNEEIAAADIRYVQSSGELSIKTTAFGTFVVTWENMSEAEENAYDFTTSINSGSNQNLTLSYDLTQSSYIRTCYSNNLTLDGTFYYTGTNSIYPGAITVYDWRGTPTVTFDGKGGITATTDYCIHVGTSKAANVTINGGTYIAPLTAVNCQNGTVTINGGHFEYTGSDGRYLLNCIDSNYQNGTAKIIVKGGTFVNFDPSNCEAEGAGTNFVAAGYKVVSATQSNGDIWYTVIAE